MTKKNALIPAVLAGLALVVAAGPAVAQTSPSLRVSVWNTHIKPGDTYPFPNNPIGIWAPPERVSIQNVGTTPITFEGSEPITVSGPAAGMYYVLQEPKGTLAPGQFFRFNLQLVPTQVGLNEATVTIQTDDPVAPSFAFTVESVAGNHPGGGPFSP